MQTKLIDSLQLDACVHQVTPDSPSSTADYSALMAPDSPAYMQPVGYAGGTQGVDAGPLTRFFKVTAFLKSNISKSVRS